MTTSPDIATFLSNATSNDVLPWSQQQQTWGLVVFDPCKDWMGVLGGYKTEIL